jgi:hypothetical protein
VAAVARELLTVGHAMVWRVCGCTKHKCSNIPCSWKARLCDKADIPNAWQRTTVNLWQLTCDIYPSKGLVSPARHVAVWVRWALKCRCAWWAQLLGPIHTAAGKLESKQLHALHTTSSSHKHAVCMVLRPHQNPVATKHAACMMDPFGHVQQAPHHPAVHMHARAHAQMSTRQLQLPPADLG